MPLYVILILAFQICFGTAKSDVKVDIFEDSSCKKKIEFTGDTTVVVLIDSASPYYADQHLKPNSTVTLKCSLTLTFLNLVGGSIKLHEDGLVKSDRMSLKISEMDKDSGEADSLLLDLESDQVKSTFTKKVLKISFQLVNATDSDQFYAKISITDTTVFFTWKVILALSLTCVFIVAGVSFCLYWIFYLKPKRSAVLVKKPSYTPPATLGRPVVAEGFVSTDSRGRRHSAPFHPPKPSSKSPEAADIEEHSTN